MSIHPEKFGVNELLPFFSSKQVAKNTLLLREGQICNYIFYIQSGLAKLFSVNEDRTFIMYFYPENSFVTAIDSFTFQQPSHFQIMVTEDAEILMLHREDYEKLCQQNPAVESLFRRQLQMVASRMLRRVSAMIENDASRRYEIFLNENSHLVQRISLAEMADYLGITQVSLSRIRAKK